VEDLQTALGLDCRRQAFQAERQDRGGIGLAVCTILEAHGPSEGSRCYLP
jgi:hypothetical protein